MAVGMAIASAPQRRVRRRSGRPQDWVVAGDGCLMEGINHEAAGLAGHLGLGRLIVFWDDNKITIDGSTALSTSEDIEARYSAYHWHIVRCDGHDMADVRRAIEAAIADPRPSLIACKTIIGKGAPNKQGTAATHGAALGGDEVAAGRSAGGPAVRSAGRSLQAGARGRRRTTHLLQGKQACRERRARVRPAPSGEPGKALQAMCRARDKMARARGRKRLPINAPAPDDRGSATLQLQH